MNRAEKRRLSDLAGKLCDETLSDEEFDELESMIGKGAEMQEWYLHCIQQNSILSEIEIESLQEVTGRGSLKPVLSWPVMAAASLGFLGLVSAIIFGLANPSAARAEQPTVSYHDDSVSLHYEDGTVAVLEKPSRFRLDGSRRVHLESGKMVARRGSGSSNFEIAMADHTFRPGVGEFGISVGEGAPELHVFDGGGDFENTNKKGESQSVAPGEVFRIASEGELNPSLISMSTRFNSRHVFFGRGILEDFSKTSEATSPGWLGDYYSAIGGQTEWHTLESPGLTRESGSFLSVSRKDGSDPAIYHLPVGGERRELKASQVQLSREYRSTEGFAIHQPHTIEFLFRLDSNPADLYRIAMFDAPVDVKLEPQPNERTWNIHCGTPPVMPSNAEFVWFLNDKTRAEGFQFMELKRGATYRVFIEVDPENQRFRCTISDGVQTVYNNNLHGLPKFGRDSQGLNGVIHLFAWGKPGKEVRFSVDEILIRNAGEPKRIES